MSQLVMPEPKQDRATKQTEGKVDLTMIPVAPLFEVARVYNRGAYKYARDNWRKGLPFSECYASFLRHSMSFWSGETFDPEDGLHHMAHATFWCLTLQEFGITHPEFDDRTPRVVSPSKSFQEWFLLAQQQYQQTAG